MAMLGVYRLHPVKIFKYQKLSLSFPLVPSATHSVVYRGVRAGPKKAESIGSNNNNFVY